MQFCFPLLRTCGRHIECIDKSHLNLEDIPDDVVRNYRTLEECNLEANQIHDFPKNFFRLEKLRWLSMSDNELSEIPDAFGNFIHLVYLDLSNNEILQISPNIQYCDNLLHLNLSHNPIECLPEGFTQLQRLCTLNLTETSLTQLPNDFGRLQRLEKLELRGTILQELPESFAQLQQLQTLDLGGNEFSIFPLPVTALSNLQELFLDGNHLTTLPQEIENLHRLENFDLSENELESLPDRLSGLACLVDLNLRANRLESVPDSIGDLLQVKLINLDCNLVATISSRISCCTHLSELILSSNCITKLPDKIGLLSELTFLSLSRNRLSALPATISLCENLEILLLRENRIRLLPSEIGQLKSLRVLDVADNRLSFIPVSILQCENLKSLWLSTNQSNSAVHLLQETDPKTGETVLTCFLLPQDAFANGQDGGAVDDSPLLSEDRDEEENEAPPTVVLRPSVVSQEEVPVVPFTNAVPTVLTTSVTGSCTGNDEQKNRFSFLVEGNNPVGEDARNPANSKLRTYIRFDKKTVDGHVILKDETHSKDTTFAPSRASPLPPHRDSSLESNVAELKSAILRKMSAPPLSRASVVVPPSSSGLQESEPTSANPRTIIGQAGGPSQCMHSDPTSTNRIADLNRVTAAGDRVRSISTVAYPGVASYQYGGQLMPTRKTGTAIGPSVAQLIAQQNQIEQEQQQPLRGVTEEKKEDAEHNPPRQNVAVDSKPKKTLQIAGYVALAEQDSESPTEEDNTASGKTSKKHVKTVSIRKEEVSEEDEECENRRVGFYEAPMSGEGTRHEEPAEDDKEDSDSEHRHRDTKLIRKDTPHYTKHARINYDVVNGVDNAMKVRNILEKYQRAGAGGGGGGAGGATPSKDTQSALMNNGTKSTHGLAFANEANRASSSSQWSHEQRQESVDNEDEDEDEEDEQMEDVEQNVDDVADSLSDVSQDQEEELLIRRGECNPVPLGLTVVGGVDHPCPPFDFLQRGIFVAKVTPGGAASHNRALRVGDRILRVNQHDLTMASHVDAVRSLISATGPELRLRVRHEPRPAGWKRLRNVARTALLQDGGLHIAGGVRKAHDVEASLVANADEDDGIFVTRVPSGLGINVGQRLLEVDGQSLLLGVTCADVVKTVCQAGPTLDLLVCDGVTPQEVQQYLKRWPQADVAVAGEATKSYPSGAGTHATPLQRSS